MEGIRQYLLSITVAALLCSIAVVFFQENTAFSAVIKLLTGLVLTIVILSPWMEIRLSDYEYFFEDITAAAMSVTNSGVQSANESLAVLIKEETEAYILDKAVSLELDVQIQVDLDDSSPPRPETVTIFGNASPLSRQTLSDQLVQNLDIAKENIIWKTNP